MKAVKHGVGRLYLIFQIEDNEKQTNGSQKAMYVWFIWLSYWSNHSGNSVGRLKFLAHLTLNIKQDSTLSTVISSVQFSLSCVWPHIVTSWTEAHQASLSITNSWSLLKLMSIELVMHPTISSSVIPSPPAFNLSQHEGLFQWVSSSHQVAKVLELQLQHQSFQWIFKFDILAVQGKSSTTVQKHQFFGAQLSL